MSLLGKLCIGILEEDNPQKSYFRFKPILVEADGRYVPYAGTYPEEGCIRIVPDKNEAYHFKARMRQMGLFCAVDLRAHPDENDKIRPNKNYREGSPEKNAFIIYSDVVKSPEPQAIAQILPQPEPDAPIPAPFTPTVLLKGEDVAPRRHGWERLEGDEARARLLPTEADFPLETAQVFDVEGPGGQALSFAILPPPPRPAPQEPPKPRPEPQKPEPRPEPETPPKPEDGDKPWIHRDSTMLPRPVDPRLSPAERSLAAQSGLNPRRGRSLQELIDEKWQQSRLNQLGQPIAPIQTGAPVTSPVQGAVDAVRDAWSQPQLRRDLLESLSGIEEFGASLEECREAARQSDIERHLQGLEAQRLALLGEIDRLSLRNTEVRAALKKELLQERDAEVAEAEARVRAARDAQLDSERQLEQTRAAARDARAALDAMTGEELERRLTDFTLNQHMLERMAQLKGEAQAVPPAAPTLQSLDLNALAVRVMNRFDASGFAVTRMEALNLCACVAVSPVLILTGPVGSGKTETARMLGEALGLTASDRCVAFGPGELPLADDPRIRSLEALPDAPALILLDDANLYAAPDITRGLLARLRPHWRLCLTVQDGGVPLPAHALDRGFTLRLTPKAAAPWRPRQKTPCAPEAPARLSPDIPEAPLPAATVARMDALREGLHRRGATPSRRALNDAWRYCALMLAALGDGADAAAVLDRAVAQRLLPALIASAPLSALSALPALLDGLPVSRATLHMPIPVQV